MSIRDPGDFYSDPFEEDGMRVPLIIAAVLVGLLLGIGLGCSSPTAIDEPDCTWDKYQEKFVCFNQEKETE